jgi:hypothetical protein
VARAAGAPPAALLLIDGPSPFCERRFVEDPVEVVSRGRMLDTFAPELVTDKAVY